MVEQSEQLTEFYESYAGWLSQGAPQDAPFKRDEGLCWNLTFFARECGYDTLKLGGEFQTQLTKAGLGVAYPFDDRFGARFSEARARQELHLNTKRIQWVQEHSGQ